MTKRDIMSTTKNQDGETPANSGESLRNESQELKLDLLPCPFCGKPPDETRIGQGPGLMLNCRTEGCVGPYASDYDGDGVVKLWNTRAEDVNALRARIVELEQEVLNLKDPYRSWASKYECYLDFQAWATRWCAAKPQTFADGYCEHCSALSYSLTRALESTGVPTGEDGWQQSYGPNKVKALAAHESSLRQLLVAMEEGTPDDIQRLRKRAEGFLEFHARVYRALNAKAQEAALIPSSAQPKEK